MNQPEYHQVICCITQDQYDRMTEEYDSSSQKHPPLLFAMTETTGESIFEDDIALIVRDALRDYFSEDSRSMEAMCEKTRDDFNAAKLPFGLKKAILAAAGRDWQPAGQQNPRNPDSYWNRREPAMTLLFEHPELMRIFEDTPEAIGEAWLKRTTTAKNGLSKRR